MKIIQTGVIPNKWWIGQSVTCNSCGAVMEFDESDTPGQVFNPDSPEDNKVYSCCPLCGSRIELGYPQEIAASVATAQINRLEMER